jgi:hypothetical protein
MSMPIEAELIPLAQLMPIQLSATSDHEYYGPMIPKVFSHLRAGEFDEATRIYWQLHPARKIKGQIAQQMHGGHFINRYVEAVRRQFERLGIEFTTEGEREGANWAQGSPQAQARLGCSSAFFPHSPMPSLIYIAIGTKCEHG